MYTGPGERVEKVAVREVATGAPCVIGNQVGFATKNQQLAQWDDPTSAAATTIAIGESCLLTIGSVGEVELADGLAAGDVDDLVYIDPTDDSLKLAADAEEGDLPLGVIQEVDAARDIARVNTRSLHAFMAVPAAA